MIDTHAHLDFENFDEDREEVIRRAFDNGVKKIINIGVDLETSQKSIALAEKYENIFAAVGFHPHDAEEIPNSASDDDFEELKKLAKNKKVVAIGEVGLDYSRFSEADKIEQQKNLFSKQLDIAAELNLPVVIHCREAWKDLFGIISKIPGTRFVLHCYSGEKEDTEKFLELSNVFFSFSGNITYPPRKSPSSPPFNKGGEVEDVIRMIPLDRIMLDSDSPFLAPQEERGKRNEPENIRFIAKKIADIKQISGEEVERTTEENAEKFFGIGRLG
jgi:TatD DNase family protein